MEKNTCYTYFAIKGDFNPDDITLMMGLTPSKFWCIGDKRQYGKGSYDFSLWEYGRCDTYDVETSNQMTVTISDLKSKRLLLQEIKEKYDAVFTLEIVPCIYVGESAPSLAPSREIIEFCYLTGTEIDIDLYLYE